MTRHNNRRHDLRVIYKVPFRFNGVRKRRKNIKKKTQFFFLCKKRAVLYSVAITAFLSNTRTHTHAHARRRHAHSFILVSLISNTSVKCNTYIYLYIMKELKMRFSFHPRTFYSIMNSNRHEDINIIMTSQRN